MQEKQFKTIDQQLEILRSRGLEIADEERARSFLMQNNYYRISGYSLTLRSHDKFHKNASFQNIIDIYNFDHELRYVIMKYIEIIEVHCKSVFAYEFTKEYGPSGYLSEENFTDKRKYDKIIQKAEEQKNKRLPHEPYLKHYIDELRQPLPLWACVDLFTIADISILYTIVEQKIQRNIADEFGISHKVLGHFMHSMTIIRNLCAHGGRLYNRLFEQKPNLTKKERELLIEIDGQRDDAHLYGFVFLMKRLLNSDQFAQLKLEIISLAEKYPYVDLKYYGFRRDWKEVL